MAKARLHTVPLTAAAESHETIFDQQGPFSFHPLSFQPLNTSRQIAESCPLKDIDTWPKASEVELGFSRRIKIQCGLI